MTGLQKIFGLVFPPYKNKVQRQELTLLVDSLINSLPEEFHELKEQRRRTNLFFLSDWALFPGFKFMSIGYPGTTLNDFKKRGQNYRLSGERIFSKRVNDFVNVEFIINDNYLAGLRVENSNYQADEFDLKRIEVKSIQKTPVEFPPSELDLFFERLDDNLKSKLNPDNIFDIDFGNRTYYAFYDLEDGNYLATDKKLNVYSLVHDAQPMAKKLNYSLADILADIETKAFDKDKHLESRYKNGA
ncbi:MAG: hypothetical protein QY309_13385 [Cyclobacteriaceae bacterium]|nr:MAG: hypothetical protein QY309_13385 [Cyclobacteriaceae bacterium]